MELTVETLKNAKFKGPVRFYDGRNGMARQDFQCVEEPRFGYFWQREHRRDRGRQAYMVDGNEVASLEEACRLLALPPDPNSPEKVLERSMEELGSSPSLNYGATRALSEARCNADAGPFAMMRTTMQRAGHSFHGGINKYSEAEREAGREFPHWLYNIKSAAHETYRAMYLFENDRKEDTGLKCALGQKCRDCPILQRVEATMEADRQPDKRPWQYAIEDFDIDAIKTWTCIGHILTERGRVIDGSFFHTRHDRDDF